MTRMVSSKLQLTKVVNTRTVMSDVEMGQVKETELVMVGETETKNTFTPTVNTYLIVRSDCGEVRHFSAMSVIMAKVGSMFVV